MSTLGLKEVKLLVIWLALSSSLLGQELELFEETESGSTVRESLRADPPARDRDGNLITGPQFSLIGTGRIGYDYLVLLQDRLGETISVSVGVNQSQSVPGYPGFQLTRVGSGDVSITYPSEIPCIEFREEGVICASEEEAIISLTNSDPIELSVRGNGPTISDGTRDASSPGSNAVNPFEAILQGAANQNSDTNSTAFEPIRIDPSDVPPGMKVVSTPFGDRLIEDDC